MEQRQDSKGNTRAGLGKQMCSRNRETLTHLFTSGEIDLLPGAIFDSLPLSLPDDFDFDRVEGMMLGLAIGDALGNTTEGWPASDRRTVFGEIRDYVAGRSGANSAGLPSDDSQLAFWTLEQMLADDGFCPENVAARYCRGTIRGVGSTVSRFLAKYHAGLPWHQCGPKSAGNGALMRIAPMLVPHLKCRSTDLWVDTALSAMMTHNDAGSIAACLSFVKILWELLRSKSPPEPEWWPSTYTQVAVDLESESCYRPRGGLFRDYEGPIYRFVLEKTSEAYRADLGVFEACERWFSGAFLLETVPSVIYILMRCAHDPEEAIVRAVNDTWDNDTIGAIVGAAVGALHGRAKLPDRWVTALPGRTSMDEADDGRVFELLRAARQKWG